jgi:hypothetical protein
MDRIYSGVELSLEKQSAMLAETTAKLLTAATMAKEAASLVKDLCSPLLRLNLPLLSKTLISMMLKSSMESTSEFQWDRATHQEVLLLTNADLQDQSILTHQGSAHATGI